MLISLAGGNNRIRCIVGQGAKQRVSTQYKVSCSSSQVREIFLLEEGTDEPAFWEPFDRMFIEAAAYFPLLAYPGRRGWLLQCLGGGCDTDTS